MHAISKRFTPRRRRRRWRSGRGRRRARSAGPRGGAARDRGGGRARRIPRERSTARSSGSCGAKARLGLQRARAWTSRRCPRAVGGRAHEAVAVEIASRAITLLKDERGQVPLRLPAEARACCCCRSSTPRAAGARPRPGRVLIPELRKRFPGLTAVEVTDRTTADELDLVRALAKGADAIVAATFVRAAAASGERACRRRSRRCSRRSRGTTRAAAARRRRARQPLRGRAGREAAGDARHLRDRRRARGGRGARALRRGSDRRAPARLAAGPVPRRPRPRPRGDRAGGSDRGPVKRRVFATRAAAAGADVGGPGGAASPGPREPPRHAPAPQLRPAADGRAAAAQRRRACCSTPPATSSLRSCSPTRTRTAAPSRSWPRRCSRSPSAWPWASARRSSTPRC